MRSPLPADSWACAYVHVYFSTHVCSSACMYAKTCENKHVHTLNVPVYIQPNTSTKHDMQHLSTEGETQACIYIYTCIYVYIYIHIYICADRQTDTHTHTRGNPLHNTQIHTCVYCVHTCMCMCTCSSGTYMYMFCVHTHTYSFTHATK
jgi:hypothetical protein